MDEHKLAKLKGAKIFTQAVAYIKTHGWNHNSMEILLKVSRGQVWPQPMAVLMFSELEHALGTKTLTQFDLSVSSDDVIKLFRRVSNQLTTSN